MPWKVTKVDPKPVVAPAEVPAEEVEPAEADELDTDGAVVAQPDGWKWGD